MNARTETKAKGLRAQKVLLLPPSARCALAALFVAALAAPLGSAGRSVAAEAQQTTQPAASREPLIQKECPVMIGNRIDPSIFTVYKGRRVYFCCAFCKSEFQKDPERYLHRLPQFAAASADTAEEQDTPEHAGAHLHPASLIEPMGVLTLALIAATVALGVFRRLKPRRMLRWHKILGVAALISGAAHASLVLLS
jgi:hypothetical protein